MKLSIRSFNRVVLGLTMATSVCAQAAVVNIANQDAFIQQLKDHKRLVVIVIDRTQFKASTDVGKALTSLHTVLYTIGNNPQFQLSKIKFAIVDLANLPQDTRTELITAMGGKLNEPATAVLFENGSMIVHDAHSIAENALFDDTREVIHALCEAIHNTWGSYIDHCLDKCNRADIRRAFTQAKKEQVALAQYQVDQQGFAVTEPVGNQNITYNPAQYGYGEQPAYLTDDGSVYYNYPYYNGGIVPGVGIGVGVGLGAAAVIDNDYRRGDFRSDRGDFRGGAMRGGEFHGGAMRGGARGRR